MKRLYNWLAGKVAPKAAPPRRPLRETGSHLRQSGTHVRSQPVKPAPIKPPSELEVVELDPHVAGRIEDNGPGKNVLIRNRYVREETGTHDTLKILDDSIIDTEEQTGIDPYNTGQFDRSRNWDKRSRD